MRVMVIEDDDETLDLFIEYLKEIGVRKVLGASISNDYDLTEALKHVGGKVYVYTSTHDRMLGKIMPLSVTADLKKDVPGAGIDGFVLPEGAGSETGQLYASKIVTIPWDKELEKDGDYGHHFDNVKPAFIRDHVAPLFMGKSVPLLRNRPGTPPAPEAPSLPPPSTPEPVTNPTPTPPELIPEPVEPDPEVPLPPPTL